MRLSHHLRSKREAVRRTQNLISAERRKAMRAARHARLLEIARTIDEKRLTPIERARRVLAGLGRKPQRIRMTSGSEASFEGEHETIVVRDTVPLDFATTQTAYGDNDVGMVSYSPSFPPIGTEVVHDRSGQVLGERDVFPPYPPMEEESARMSDAMAEKLIDCPKCGALKGVRCKRKKEGQPHLERVAAMHYRNANP